MCLVVGFVAAGLWLGCGKTPTRPGGWTTSGHPDAARPVGPPVPVSISYRESAVGRGKVAVVSNQSGDTLNVLVAHDSPARGRHKTGYLNLPPGRSVEIGWLEGWRFESGDRVSVSHAGFQPQSVLIP
jgi:hypothetical protein